MRLAAVAVLALPLLAGMPLAAQTVQFAGAVATLAVADGGFNKPSDVAVDQYGNVFVADEGNNAVKEILAAGGYTTVTTLTSGLQAPMGVAVDGSGNVYVTDGVTHGVYEILAVKGSIPASPTINPLGGTFSFCNPIGVAVDGSENVYVADECNGAVEEILAAGVYTMVTTLASALGSPWYVALDQSGDVWFTDTQDKIVREMLAVNGSVPANPAIITPMSSSEIRCPWGVGVDGSGNVYVTDDCYNTVLEMPAPGYSTVNSLGGGYDLPLGLAGSASGNVFVADTYNNAVKEILPGANFGPVNVGSANTNLVTLYFTFAASVTLGSTAVLTQGAAGLDFTDAGAGNDTCTANKAYSAGDTCGVNVTFKPEAPGPRYGAAELVDTSGNVLATGDLQGTGIGPLVNFMPDTLSQAVSNFGFSRPVAVAVDASSNLYVADAGNYEVYEFLAKSGYSSFNQLGPGFLNPQGVAVDGSGNVYVTDGDTSAVYEILAVKGSIPANPTINILSSGFDDPAGVAVDGSGNVYVADPFNEAVYEILAVNGAIPANPTITTLASSRLQPQQVGAPQYVAVDGSGNVYVTDIDVYEILAVNGSVPANPTFKTLGAPTEFPYPVPQWVQPWGVAVDGSGNVYVTDIGGQGVYEILAASGYATVNTLRQTANIPWGVAVDASRNVYYVTAASNPGSGTVPPGEAAVEKIDYADPPSLSFATTDVGSTSTDSPQTVTVENVGNAALTFPTPATITSPSFPLATGSTCPQLSPETLAPGATCTYALNFSPTTPGNLTGSLVLTDNNLNAPSPSYAAQSIALSGTAFEPGSFALTNSGAIIVSPGSATGNMSTITVTPSNGFTGTVNLSCSVTTFPTGATSPATCAVTPSVTISGTTAQNATLTVNTASTTTPGAYAVTVTGMYINPGAAGGITEMTTVGVTVTAAASFSLSSNPSAFTLTPGVNTGDTSALTVTPANAFTGPVNLTCSVTGPTGATSPATCVVTPSVTISGTTAQSATLTVTTTSSTTPGTYMVTVTGTAGSITQATTVDVTVTAPVSGSFSVDPIDDMVGVVAGGSGTGFVIYVEPIGGFTGSVTLTAAITS
ncbi:MAG: choice-of-anchor D domain-containing protein, partial [Terracidiphilus sp.]